MCDERYVVIVTYTFDPEVSAAEFCGEDAYNKAKAYLHWLWEDYMNEEFANNSDLEAEFCYCEDEYAQIEFVGGDRTEFNLTTINKPNEKFAEVNWERYL